MARPRGPDPRKIEKIIDILKEHPEGLWVMEISRLTGLNRNTVHRYIHYYLSDIVEECRNFHGAVILYRLKYRFGGGNCGVQCGENS